MQQNFTPTLLIKYLYKETTASETIAIREALEQDLLLREEFQVLQQAQRQLPKVQFYPKVSTLQSILQHSRQTALEKHY